MKTKYYVTFLVRDDVHYEDEYPIIARFETLEESIDFAKKTVGTVEVCGVDWNNETKQRDDTGEHIGFVDGEQHYHDKE